MCFGVDICKAKRTLRKICFLTLLSQCIFTVHILESKYQEEPWVQGAIFNCTAPYVIGMDNFGCLNSSLSLFHFYFVIYLQKKLCCMHAYSWSTLHTSKYTFTWSNPPHSKTNWWPQKGFIISTQFKMLQSMFARKFPIFMLIQTLLHKRTELISECPTDNISINQS